MRLRLFLLMIAILLTTAGTTAAVSEHLDLTGGSGGDTPVIEPGSATATTTSTMPSTTATTTATGPSAREIQIAGPASAVHLEGVELDPAAVPTPLTIDATPGFGNGAEITSVLVDGDPATIVWDGGRPFVLASGPALLVGVVTLDVVPEGIHLALGPGAHHFLPGFYRLDTPVAVGSGSQSRAVQDVEFGTDVTSALTATGDAGLLLPPVGSQHLVGTGPLHLEGTLSMIDGATAQTLARLDSVNSSYDLTLTRAAGGGWTISGTVRGQLSTG